MHFVKHLPLLMVFFIQTYSYAKCDGFLGTYTSAESGGTLFLDYNSFHLTLPDLVVEGNLKKPRNPEKEGKSFAYCELGQLIIAIKESKDIPAEWIKIDLYNNNGNQKSIFGEIRQNLYNFEKTSDLPELPSARPRPLFFKQISSHPLPPVYFHPGTFPVLSAAPFQNLTIPQQDLTHVCPPSPFFHFQNLTWIVPASRIPQAPEVSQEIQALLNTFKTLNSYATHGVKDCSQNTLEPPVQPNGPRFEDDLLLSAQRYQLTDEEMALYQAKTKVQDPLAPLARDPSGSLKCRNFKCTLKEPLPDLTAYIRHAQVGHTTKFCPFCESPKGCTNTGNLVSHLKKCKDNPENKK